MCALYANPKRRQNPHARSTGQAPKTEAPEQKLQEQRHQGQKRLRTEAPKAGGCQEPGRRVKGEPAKKKLTAVFRPQNAQQQIKRPVPPKPRQQTRAIQHQLRRPARPAQRQQHRQYRQEAARPQVQAQSADTVSEKARQQPAAISEHAEAA
ncbi:MAG: hypothetical protein ACLTBV_08000 [Enterocloster bolteae]